MGQDTLYVAWNGGGGFGDPLERDPGQVGVDVGSRFVTREAARQVYGVMTDADGVVDLAATKRLRAEIRGARMERRAAE
jgi:N-methylhydantoinase B